jgi:hypothetical protein
MENHRYCRLEGEVFIPDCAVTAIRERLSHWQNNSRLEPPGIASTFYWPHPLNTPVHRGFYGQIIDPYKLGGPFGPVQTEPNQGVDPVWSHHWKSRILTALTEVVSARPVCRAYL